MHSDVVVLGCGLGGLTVTEELSGLLARNRTVTVVEPQARIPLPSSFSWLVFGWREPAKVQKDLKKIGRKNVRVVAEKVQSIDLSGKSVKTQSYEIEYDKLIVAVGAELALDQVPGLDVHGQNFYSIDGAMKLRDAVETFPGGSIIVAVSRMPFKCPAAPYEMALLLDEQMRRVKKSVVIQLLTPEPHPVPAAGAVIGKQVERLLASRGIKYLPRNMISKVEKDRVLLENGSALHHDLLVMVPPHRSPRVVVDAGLAEPSGWVPVNPQTLATKFEDVYAIGDVTSIETPHGHVPYLPKAGVFAQGQGKVVANNIAVSITGKGHLMQWDGIGACHLQVSKSEAAFLQGSFLSHPPRIEFHPPARKWYLDKVKREKNWLA